LNRYESRYCSYHAPSEWEPEPPFGYSEPGGAEGRSQVQLLEIWLSDPQSAAEYANKQKEVLPHLLQEFELVDEGGYQTSGPGDAHFLRYRHFSDDGDTTIETKIIVAQGPLLCEMTLNRHDEPDEERDRILDAIGRTLTLQNTDFLSKPETIALMPALAREDSSKSDTEHRLAFPRACVSIPPPKGWDVSEKDGDVIFELGNSSIRLHRHLGELGDANTWFRERMKGLQDGGSLLLSSENGELESGCTYAALLSNPGELGTTWGTAAEKRALLVFVEDQQPFEWSLLCPKDSFEICHPVLQTVIAETDLLDSSQWQTKLAEPWIDLTLSGGWRAEGEGLYLKMEEKFVFLYLNKLPCNMPLKDLSPSVVDNVRGGVETVVEEDQALGLWHQMDSFRYSLDGILEDGRNLFVRTTWVAFDEQIYAAMIQGIDKGGVESLMKDVLEGLRVASAASGSD
jgi:hypothetical protein